MSVVTPSAPIPGTIRRAIAAAVVVACVVLIGVSHVSAQAFTKVTAKLESRSFEQVLPFDEEFKIAGTTPAAIHLMQVFYRQVDAEPPPCPYRTGETNGWSGPYTFESVKGATAFEVHIPTPLEAERTYTFRFCYTGDAPEATVIEFRRLAVTRFDAEIAATKVRSIDVDRARLLRKDACNLLRSELLAGLTFRQSSLFDCATEDQQRLNQFTMRLFAVLTAQFRLRDALNVTELTREIGDLTSALGRLGDLPELDSLTTKLRQSKHVATETVARISELTADKARELAQGTGDAVAVPAPALADRDTAVAADVVKNYDRTAEALRNLQQLLATTLENKDTTEKFQATLLKDQQLSDGEIEALRRLAPPNAPDGCAPGLPLVCAVSRAVELRNRYDRARGAPEERTKAIQALADLISLETVDATSIRASTIANVDTNKTNYVSAEAGFLAMPRQREAATYIGTNIYFRPINPKAPLSRFGGFGRRVSMTVGLTVNSIADTEATRFDLFGSQALIVGFGVRVSEVLRLSAGTVVFKKLDENPFVTRKSYAFEPYVAFSVDLNMAVGADGFGNLFKSKKTQQEE
jgi:hypothetical protein